MVPGVELPFLLPLYPAPGENWPGAGLYGE